MDDFSVIDGLSLHKESINYNRKGKQKMSLINKEVSPFSVQAYYDNTFKTVTKNDLMGKWSVFFFYPADFTFVCPTELEDLQDNYDSFKKIEVSSGSVGRNAEELLRKVEACQFVRKNGNEVCPAKWKPGAKTLKPGIDLVGKI